MFACKYGVVVCACKYVSVCVRVGVLVWCACMCVV